MTVPEEKTPWLRLARLTNNHDENKRLWNGYQKYLLRPNEEDYQRQMENPKFAAIAELSDTTIHAIQTKIQDLPTELGQYDPINMAAGVPEIKMPLNLEGFYFAFPVWLMGLRFKESLNLDNAQFSYGAHFTGCVFEKHLWARESNFGGDANFVDCKFNEGSSFRFATFGIADFRSANFEGHNNFEKARFTSDVLFEDARFSSSVCFEAAEFHASVNFNVGKISHPGSPVGF